MTKAATFKVTVHCGRRVVGHRARVLEEGPGEATFLALDDTGMHEITIKAIYAEKHISMLCEYWQFV